MRALCTIGYFAFGLFMMAIVIGGLAITFPAHAAGSVDRDAVDASRAGINYRQSTARISILKATPKGWVQDEMTASRQSCGTSSRELLKVTLESRLRKLTDDDLYGLLIDETDLPEYCLVRVYNSATPEQAFYVLLTTEQDYVFHYKKGELYTPWSKVDHHVAKLDTIELDPWTTTGIAPAGRPMVQVAVNNGVKIVRYWPKLESPGVEMLERLFNKSHQRLPTVPVEGQEVPVPAIKP